MQIVAGQITVADLAAMAEATFGDMVTAVVDLGRGLLAMDAGGNRTRSVDDPAVREAIEALIGRVLVP